MKSGNANLPIGGLKNAIQENGVPGLATRDLETLQKCTSTGMEKKPIAFLSEIMNRTLRGELRCDVPPELSTTQNLSAAYHPSVLPCAEVWLYCCINLGYVLGRAGVTLTGGIPCRTRIGTWSPPE